MNRKQSFSKEQICIDLNQQAWPPMYCLVLLMLGVAVSVVAVWLGIYSDVEAVVVVMFSLLGLFLLVSLIGTVAHVIVYKSAAKSKNFTVVKDEVSCFEDNVRKLCLLDFAIKEDRLHKSYLYFKQFGSYCIPARGLYTWLKQHEAGDQEVAVYSSPNEVYYVVTTDGKYPLMVYNTKLFEYKE